MTPTIRTGSSRRLSWPLLALLLTALVVGTLIVGSQLLRKVPAVAPPVATEFACASGSPPTPGPVDQARPPISYGAPMAFDRHAGRIVLLAQGLAEDLETWTFDVCSNAWTRMRPVQEPDGVGQIVYDVDSDVTITIGNGRVWAYDLEANTWTAKGPIPASLHSHWRLVYAHISGTVLVQGSPDEVETEPSELWQYDVDTDLWTPVRRQAGAPTVLSAHEGVLAYDASVDRLVSYDSRALTTRLFDPRTGAWSKSSAVTPKVNFGWGPSGGEIAYDERTGRTIVFSYGRVIAYDAVADRWEVLVAGWDPDDPGRFSGPTCRWMPWMVYDSVNQRLVVYGGQYPQTSTLGENPEWVQADDVLAFDTVTRQWTVLLEARNVVPAPS